MNSLPVLQQPCLQTDWLLQFDKLSGMIRAPDRESRQHQHPVSSLRSELNMYLYSSEIVCEGKRTFLTLLSEVDLIFSHCVSSPGFSKVLKFSSNPPPRAPSHHAPDRLTLSLLSYHGARWTEKALGTEERYSGQIFYCFKTRRNQTGVYRVPAAIPLIPPPFNTQHVWCFVEPGVERR